MDLVRGRHSRIRFGADLLSILPRLGIIVRSHLWRLPPPLLCHLGQHRPPSRLHPRHALAHLLVSGGFFRTIGRRPDYRSSHARNRRGRNGPLRYRNDWGCVSGTVAKYSDGLFWSGRGDWVSTRPMDIARCLEVVFILFCL